MYTHFNTVKLKTNSLLPSNNSLKILIQSYQYFLTKLNIQLLDLSYEINFIIIFRLLFIILSSLRQVLAVNRSSLVERPMTLLTSPNILDLLFMGVLKRMPRIWVYS